MATYTMPMRNERAAPTFDSSKPRELSRYFEDLEQLMHRAAIDTEAEKKKQVLRYLDFNTEQIWKTFPEFSADDKTYRQFKDAILVHYPDASGDFVYSMKDMDLLIGERQRLGINSTKDLSDYHLQFIAITTWLISKEQLGALEQQRYYIRAFPSALLTAVMNRLQLKDADHHPSIPHKIEKVYEAARFILQGYSVFTQNLITASNSQPPPTQQQSQSQSSPSSPQATTPSPKNEDLGSLIAGFTKSIIDAIHSTQPRGPPRSQDGKIECNYCGEEHFIRDCPHVITDTQAGKCRRNQEGKVILSTGAFVPRDVTGKYLRDRINEWHRRHPNQLAAATLIHTIDKRIVDAQPPPTQTTYQLTTNDRIAVLEAELFNLRARRPHPPANRTRAQKARNANAEDDDEVAVAAARAQQSRIEEVPDEDAPQPPKETPKEASSTSTQSTTTPEHPYRSAKDAAYSPPVTKNVGAQDKPVAPTNKKPEPAYRTLPPIHDPLIAQTVYKRSLEAPITITQRELLSLSPEVRSQFRDSTITKRIPTKESPTAQALYQDEVAIDSETEITVPLFSAFSSPEVFYAPDGSITISDPVETYYRSLPPGFDPVEEALTVALESSAIRSIEAFVDSRHRIECILDPGCQVITMSAFRCNELALAYDPSIRLNMQSANGNCNLSLGLARNVPFLIESLTFYLQVHIVQSPAYEVLLGRPFDILTESVIRNFSNEDQTITIKDPNTGQRITIPTLPRSTRSLTKVYVPRRPDF